MASKTINTLKPLSKVREMNLRSLKLKEESISTLLTTIKSNQKFAKLLIFTLNSLQGFISPPNKEISINASIIIKLDGIEVLHLISVTNINKDEIISLAGDIFYKLISINDVFDKELTKLFAEKNGHKVIIDILLKRKKEGKFAGIFKEKRNKGYEENTYLLPAGIYLYECRTGARDQKRESKGTHKQPL